MKYLNLYERYTLKYNSGDYVKVKDSFYQSSYLPGKKYAKIDGINFNNRGYDITFYDGYEDKINDEMIDRKLFQSEIDEYEDEVALRNNVSKYNL